MHAVLGVVAGTMLRRMRWCMRARLELARGCMLRRMHQRMRARLELAVACERHDVDVAALNEIKRGIHVPPEILAHLTLILS